MMVMTAKVNFRKMIIGVIAVAAVILALVLLLGGGKDTAPTASTAVTGNDARVAFLKELGWEVNASPTQSGQVRIPKDADEVFDRYNALQKSQNYDLTPLAGKTVMRYVYTVTNYPGATEPVYATLLVYKNQIIGGDITDTAPGGQIRALKKEEVIPSPSTAPSTAPETTAPTETEAES